MPTRNVVLTDHQAHFVEQLVTSGRYQNASEVLREGLRLVERREEYRIGSVPPGLTSPNKTLATAAPPSEPGCQASRMAGTWVEA